MRDLGDAVTLAATCVDATGTPANADTVTLTVTLPDGTSSAQSPTNPPAETGKYTHPYVSTAAGRHFYRWTFTGTVPDQAYADAFNVIDSSWAAIVGLIETKEHLNYRPDDTTDDEELRGFILSASAVVEDIVGVVARREITETHSGGQSHLILLNSPVLAVTQITEDGTVRDPGDYTVSRSGLVARRSGVFPSGFHNIDVTYTVGRSVAPPNVIDGVKELIRINWRPQQGGNYSAFDQARGDDFGQVDESGLQGHIRLGFFVPNTVFQRLSPDRRGPVVM